MFKSLNDLSIRVKLNKNICLKVQVGTKGYYK